MNDRPMGFGPPGPPDPDDGDESVGGSSSDPFSELFAGGDPEAMARALQAAGVATLDGPFLDFLDPWGNRVEIVGYDNIQFTKAPNVLRGMGLTRLAKNESAKKELAQKGMAVE